MDLVKLAEAGAAVNSREDWWSEVRAVFFKDLHSEWRTKAAIAGIAFFSLTTVMLFSFLVRMEGLGMTMNVVSDPEAAMAKDQSIFFREHTLLRSDLLSALFWLITYFCAMTALPRSFQKEEEAGTAPILLLTARPSAIFTGKLLFNATLLCAVTSMIVPLFLLFLKPEIRHWPLFLAHAYIGALGFAGAGSILGAIAAKAQNRGFLMVVTGFGPLLPILVLSVKGMTASMQAGGGNYLIALVSYVIVMVLASGFLFEKVWEA